MLLSVREDGKLGLAIALFSVRQGRWVYLFSEMASLKLKLYSFTHSLDRLGLASPAQCTLYGNPRTVDRNSWKRLQIEINVLT